MLREGQWLSYHKQQVLHFGLKCTSTWIQYPVDKVCRICSPVSSISFIIIRLSFSASSVLIQWYIVKIHFPFWYQKEVSLCYVISINKYFCWTDASDASEDWFPKSQDVQLLCPDAEMTSFIYISFICFHAWFGSSLLCICPWGAFLLNGRTR